MTEQTPEVSLHCVQCRCTWMGGKDAARCPICKDATVYNELLMDHQETVNRVFIPLLEGVLECDITAQYAPFIET